MLYYKNKDMAGKNRGLMLMVITLVVFVGYMGNEAIFSQQKTPTTEEIKSSSKSIPYDEIMENSESYTGKILFFRGKIVQVMDGTENNNYNESFISFTFNKIVQVLDGTENEYVLLIATKVSPYVGYSDDIIWVKYKGKRMQENDIVDVWGRFGGLKTQYTVFGTELILPRIDYLYLESLKKVGEQ